MARSNLLPATVLMLFPIILGVERWIRCCQIWENYKFVKLYLRSTRRATDISSISALLIMFLPAGALALLQIVLELVFFEFDLSGVVARCLPTNSQTAGASCYREKLNILRISQATSSRCSSSSR